MIADTHVAGFKNRLICRSRRCAGFVARDEMRHAFHMPHRISITLGLLRYTPPASSPAALSLVNCTPGPDADSCLLTTAAGSTGSSKPITEPYRPLHSTSYGHEDPPHHPQTFTVFRTLQFVGSAFTSHIRFSGASMSVPRRQHHFMRPSASSSLPEHLTGATIHTGSITRPRHAFSDLHQVEQPVHDAAHLDQCDGGDHKSKGNSLRARFLALLFRRWPPIGRYYEQAVFERLHPLVASDPPTSFHPAYFPPHD
jgi:hypothetical protein